MSLGYVVGAGKTRFGPTSRSMIQLAQDAVCEALDDADLGPEDLDAFVVANFLGGPNDTQLHLNSVVAGLFPGVRLPSWRVEAACASGGLAIHQALLSLHRYPRVLVLGIERMSSVGGITLARNIGMAGDALLDQSVGLIFPANYALVAQTHMEQYGTLKEDLEAVSLKNHSNALLNPTAHFHHKRVSKADIEAGPTVSSPLRLFDCCPVSDGAAAVILSREATGKRSISVRGSGVASDSISLVQRETLTSFPAAVDAASRAYAESGLAPGAIDFAEVHDCFTIAELVAMEDLGLCEPGESGRLTRDGATAREGRLPINPGGGLKAGGHAIGATGVGQVYEVVTQLRGEAGGRQLGRARVGLAHNVGGVGGTCAVHILEGGCS